MDTAVPPAIIKAFAVAQELAQQSPVVRYELAPVDIQRQVERPDNPLARIRKALIDTAIEHGARVDRDYDGDLFHARLGFDDDGELWTLMGFREEAGYLYGLAIGLILGRGGLR
jgi:hypothetical protein